MNNTRPYVGYRGGLANPRKGDGTVLKVLVESQLDGSIDRGTRGHSRNGKNHRGTLALYPHILNKVKYLTFETVSDLFSTLKTGFKARQNPAFSVNRTTTCLLDLRQ